MHAHQWLAPLCRHQRARFEDVRSVRQLWDSTIQANVGRIHQAWSNSGYICPNTSGRSQVGPDAAQLGSMSSLAEVGVSVAVAHGQAEVQGARVGIESRPPHRAKMGEAKAARRPGARAAGGVCAYLWRSLAAIGSTIGGGMWRDIPHPNPHPWQDKVDASWVPTALPVWPAELRRLAFKGWLTIRDVKDRHIIWDYGPNVPVR